MTTNSAGLSGAKPTRTSGDKKFSPFCPLFRLCLDQKVCSGMEEDKVRARQRVDEESRKPRVDPVEKRKTDGAHPCLGRQRPVYFLFSLLNSLFLAAKLVSTKRHDKSDEKRRNQCGARTARTQTRRKANKAQQKRTRAPPNAFGRRSRSPRRSRTPRAPRCRRS